MNIQQKLLISIMALLVVGGGIALGVNRFITSPTTSSLSNEIVNSPESSEPNKFSENSENASQRPLKDDALKTQALQIVARPITVKTNMSLAEQQKITKEIDTLIASIKQDYNYDDPWLMLGNWRKVLGDYEGAIEAWNFLGIIRPKNYVSFHNLGELYGFYLKNYPKSEENFLKSIENNSSNFDAYSQLATVYTAFKPQAIEGFYLRGIEKNLTSPALHIMLGEYYLDLKRKNEAIRHFEEAFKLDPSNESLKREIEKLKS